MPDGIGDDHMTGVKPPDDENAQPTEEIDLRTADEVEALVAESVVMAGPGDRKEGPPPAFFIVGIGASAGGLDALATLLKRMHLDSMALVVVQHLSPDHDSVLPEILSRVSPVKVVPVVDGTRVAPNHVYVIPPNADLAILQGVLHLMPPVTLATGQGVRLPIDYFFRSLAEDQGRCAIGVILSGTGTDGTLGLKAIKEAGGITLAQEPASAKFDGMPRNAIESGWVDFYAPPEAIADELLNISKHPYLARVAPPAQHLQENIGKLILLIRTAFSTDLTYYKPNTIERRIERRMALHKIERFDDYIKFVQSTPDELRRLYKDILISVTSFFRDREPFEALKTRVFPRVIENKEVGGHIRIWVPACATGEEVYSIAICLLEYLDVRAQDYRIQIFGTDIDETSIQHARRGVYPQNIALDVSPERLHRFFVKKQTEYQVCRRIRDMVVFSVQNVTRDAPFSRLDLASCRNLLIYLRPAMQKKVLRILHYALNPHGFLMLGTSETVGDASEWFSLLDRKNKIYGKKQVPSVSTGDFGLGGQAQESATPTPKGLSHRPMVNLATLADRKILDLYGPPGVVINDDLEVLHIRGRTGPFLDPTPGAPSFNIFRLARPELHVDLRRSIHEAQAKNARVGVECKLKDGATTRPFKLEVLPLTDPETKSRCLLVLFHEPAAPREPPVAQEAGRDAVASEEQHLQELERELLVTREYLQSVIEELESSSEELKSSNEELQSSNEELQSTNEELETSKEELQSSNEELTTVNDELQNRMAELQQVNDDLHNMLTGIKNPAVIIGMDLRIRRYTHTAEKLLNLVPGDVGRSISLLDAFLLGERVEELVAEVIEGLAPLEKEILCSDQRWYLLHVTPYKTLDHSIKGAVLVLVDIDVRKRASDLSRDVAEYASSILGLIRQPLMIIDRKLRVLWVNDSFYETFQVVPQETLGNPLEKIGAGQWANPRLMHRLDELLTAASVFRDLKIRFTFPTIGERTFKVNGSRIPAIGNESILMLLSFEQDVAPPGERLPGER
jgi:two-component system CheB/CheR fusion protein